MEMLKCVYGAAGSGKTEYIYERIRENMQKGIKSFILVPEQASLDTERTALRCLGLSSQLSVEVLTFSRLCNLVFSKCGPLRLRYIDRAGKIFVAQKTMQILEKDLEYFNRNVHQRGFAQMVAKLIGELKRYGVAAEEVRAAATMVQSAELRSKLSDIARIYEEYDRLISDKYSDAEENLIKAIPGIINSGLFAGEIFITGFKSFTPVEHIAVSHLMKTAEVTVSLCADSLNATDGIFASATITWEKLKSDAAAAGVEADKPVFLGGEVKFKGNPELAHLKNNYFSYPTAIYNEETDYISIISARDSYDEVRQCAQIIARLCRRENYRYGDFLILARNCESYRAAAKAVFGEYGISCFMTAKKSLTQNPFVRKVLSAAEILAYGFSYERIMPVVRFENENYTRSEADIFENYVLAAGISHKHWNSREDWKYNPDPKRISMESVNKVKKHTVDAVLELGESISGRKTVRTICGAVLDWIEGQKINEIMSRKVEDLGGSGKTDLAMEYTRAWNAFSSVISQMEQCMGDDFVTYEKFCEMLRAACDEVSLSIAPPMADQAVFDEIDTFRKSDGKVVIALGMVDGVFPKGYVEEGMLSDAERDILSDMGIELAPTAGFKRREEQNLIYNVLTAPSERLYLSVPLGDSEGRAVQKSEIISRVKELFPKIKTINGGEVAESRNVIFKSLLGNLARVKGDTEKLSPQDKIIYDYFKNEEGLGAELAEFEASVKGYLPGERLSRAAAAELYGKKLMLSVSKLEKYNSCAFSYFMNYGLLAKARLRAGFEANNIGSILHETLYLYLKELKETGADYGAISYEECRARIAEIADEAAKSNDDLLYETSPYYRYVVLRLGAVALATAWEIVKFYANSSFRPYGFEVKIGGDGIFSGMTLDLGGTAAEVEGFIDRIDMAEVGGERYVSIIDYKSSAKNTDETLEEAGVQIQPLVYASIACANLKANPAGMMYIHMNEPMLSLSDAPTEEELEKERRKKIEIQGIVLGEDEILHSMDRRSETGEGYIPRGKASALDREQMKARVENAERKVEETALKIVSGDISIRPYVTKSYNPCRYCDYYGVCGKVKRA